MKRRIAGLAVAMLLVAAMAPAAVFAASGQAAYNGPNTVAGLEDGDEGSAGVVVTPTDSGGGGGGTSGSSLPFTGSELGVLAGAGGLLLVMGLGLRRLTHRPSET